MNFTKIFVILFLVLFSIIIIKTVQSNSSIIYSYRYVFEDGNTYKLINFTSPGKTVLTLKIKKVDDYEISNATIKMYGIRRCVGCAGCSYNPSCPGCSCASPYYGGGVAECNPCSYTPSCSENCNCPDPGYGGGLRYFKNQYQCVWDSQSYIVSCGSSFSGCSYPTCKSGFTSIGSDVVSWATTSLDIFCIDFYYKARVYMKLSDVYSVVYSTGSGLSGRCSLVSAACTEGTGYLETSKECADVGCPSVTCNCEFSAYTDSACSAGVSTPYCFVENWGCSFRYRTYRYCEEISEYSCPYSSPTSVCNFPSGGTIGSLTCLSSCYSCWSCRYYPSPPSCSCTSPYSGGGCKSCYSCSYTPSCSYYSCSCSCPSPGSGGGCGNYGPDGVYVDTLDDGSREFGPVNDFYGTETTIQLNISAIRSVLNNCVPDADGYCYFNVSIGMSSFGDINITAIDFSYSVPAPVQTIKFSVLETLKLFKPFNIVNIFQVLFSKGYIKQTESDYIPLKCSEWDETAECKKYCPDCYYQTGYSAKLRKSLFLENIGDYKLKQVKCLNYLQEGIPETIKIVYNNQYLPYSVDTLRRLACYETPELDVDEEATLFFSISTIPIIKEESQTIIGLDYTKNITVFSLSEVSLSRVFVWTDIDERATERRLYIDNVEITDNPEYSVKFHDLDGDGLYDKMSFIIPSIPANSSKTAILKAKLLRPIITVEEKKTLGIPVAGENIIFLWTVKAYNPYPRLINFKEPLNIPLEASNPKLNDIPKETYFSTTPPYGPYIYIIDSIGPYETKYYNLTFIAPPVTAEISPPLYPPFFMVGEKASLSIDINVKNWIGEYINQTRKRINLEYAEDLKVFKDIEKIDEVSFVRGFYELIIDNLAPYESRNYKLVFNIFTANATFDKYYRFVNKNNQYLVYPFKVRSYSPYPLTNLYIRVKVENYKCKDVWKVFSFPISEYPNIKTLSKEVPYICENSIIKIKLEDMNLAEEKAYAIFVKERITYFSFDKYLYDFLEFIYNIFNQIINFFSSIKL